MNFFDRLRLRAATSLAPKAAIKTSRELYDYVLSRDGGPTSGGEVVTAETAMRLAAVHACVRVLSEDIAALPLPVFERQGRARARSDSHWLAELWRQPNPWQTGFEFREMQQAHLELAGNFCALKTIVRNEVRELLPIAPSRVSIEQLPNYRLLYKITMPDGRVEPVPQELVYHVRGLSFDGIWGISPVGYAAETIGFGLQLVKYGSKLFKNGAMIGGVLSHPQLMSDDAWRRLKESFEEKYQGIDNAHKVILVEEGATFSATGMKAEEAQFLESRKYSRTEIAAIYRVPPPYIGDLDRATFSNIEQQALDYVQKGILPRARRLESRASLSLLSPTERVRFFTEHNVDGLLRGDYATRMKGYQTGVLTGFLSRNEVREKENLNPGPSELDEFLVPVNMANADQLDEPTTPSTQPQEQTR